MQSHQYNCKDKIPQSLCRGGISILIQSITCS